MSRAIELVLADVDGTLVTNEKVLTEDAKRAVAGLHKAGIKFAITSGRPPRGMAMVSKPLALDTPVAGFNGGVLVAPDLTTVIDSHDLPGDVIVPTLALLEKHGLDAWVYTKRRWLARDRSAPHVEREARTVEFEPEIVGDFSDIDSKTVVKIVGVSDDQEKMKQALKAAEDEFGDNIAASCSQPYYLDITNAKANKGGVVDSMSRILGVAPERIATIGDMPNDILMFRRSGMSIAMGQSSDEVKQQAKFVTDSNEDEGFARAIRRFILDGDGA
ncbi:MAG TPA: Cof-type HAD-IIB family hydrolase [Acidiphilium sp.]